MSILVTSVSKADGSEEVVRVPYIYYPVCFQEGQEQIRALFDNGSKVNAMSLAYTKRLGFKTWKTNVGAQKSDGSTLETFGIVIADFQIENKGGRSRFFQKAFLVADTKFEVVLGMLFLKLSNVDVAFGEETFTWRSYTINKALSTTKRIQLVDLKEFVIAALDADSNPFVMYIAVREWEEIAMDPDRKA